MKLEDSLSATDDPTRETEAKCYRVLPLGNTQRQILHRQFLILTYPLEIVDSYPKPVSYVVTASGEQFK